MSLKSLHLDLGDRAYDILITLDGLQSAETAFFELIHSRHIVIITDDHVGPLYLESVKKFVSKAASRINTLSIPAGESSKSFPIYQSVINDLLSLTIDRRTILIALGGGVVGDLVGFVAASLLRGLDFIQIPTSLLAQVDSSVGGKTGINTIAGKNLVGAFHQPRLVLADIGMLQSLPQRELKSGYAEIVKYGLLGDRDFFSWLEAHGEALLNGDPETLSHAVQISCQTKAEIVAADEREEGKRALLNLGHTFAHAFEAEAGYDGRLLHGEAVAAGLGLAFGFSRHMGLCSGQDEQRVRSHLQNVGLPSSLAELPAGQAKADRLISLMRKDKKTRDGNLILILVKQIGEAFIERNVTTTDLHLFLESL